MSNITLHREICSFCGKVAVEKNSKILEMKGDDEPNKKFIWLECGHLIIKDIPKGTQFSTLVSNWWEPEIAACNHEWNKTQCIKCREYRLFPFQVEGAEFLESALAVTDGGAIFDEMGLGKTVQSLAYLKYHSEAAPIIFVVKSGIKLQWFKEILRWLGPEYISQVISQSNDFVIPGLKGYIIAYDLLVEKTKTLKKTGKTINQGFDGSKLDFCKTVVLDECQQIKNPDSARTKAIRKLCEGKKVIGLSATPWKNRGSEFFTILNLLNPRKFPSYQGFLDQWVDFYMHGEFVKQGGIRDTEKFKEYIKEIAIRREIADVAIQMPEVNRTLQFTELDNISQKEYDSETSDFVAWYNEKVIGGEEDSFETSSNILAKLARMRHITGLAKITATVEYAEEFEESCDKKLTVFVHHQDVGQILYDEFYSKFAHKFPVLRITSDMNDEERFKVAEQFQNSKRAFLIASTLAAGEGLNLQTCGDAILHERQWNPQNEDQAAPGRFRRIGSVHSVVNVIFMTAAGTVDELLAGIVEQKRTFFHNAMNKGEMPEFSQNSLGKELAEAIVKDFNSKNREKGKLTKMASL